MPEYKYMKLMPEKRSTASIEIYLDMGDASTSLETEKEVWACLIDFMRVLRNINDDVEITSYEVEVDRTEDNELATTSNWELLDVE